MDVLHPNCAGLDVHKKTVVVCVLHAEADGNIRKELRSFERYRSLAPRKGHKRAIVAVAHEVLIIIYYMLTRHTHYQDLGLRYVEDAIAKRSNVKPSANSKRLGYQVQLQPQAA